MSSLARFVSFWLYPPLAALLLVASSGTEPARPFQVLALWAALGLLIWTLLEYCLHRFLFHWRPRSRRIRRFLATLHLRHHGDPRNRDGILVRLRYSLPVSAVVLGLLWLAAGDFNAAAWMMTGVWAGFLYYEAVHYRVHLSKRGGGLLGWQRRAHFHHHFVDEDASFGVTSPLWDWILGTRRRASPEPKQQ